MEIVVDKFSQRPIYEQLYLQVKQQITSGQLQAGDELPSMRKLAGDLAVSVITTKKAYELLAAEGYTISRPGKGVYVQALSPEFLKEKGELAVKASLMPVIELAKAENISLSHLQKLVKDSYQEGSK